MRPLGAQGLRGANARDDEGRILGRMIAAGHARSRGSDGDMADDTEVVAGWRCREA